MKYSVTDSLPYAPLPEALKRAGFASLLLFFGAGAVVASVTIGSGETAFVSKPLQMGRTLLLPNLASGLSLSAWGIQGAVFPRSP